MRKVFKLKALLFFVLAVFLLSCDDPILVKKHDDGSLTHKIALKSGESKEQAKERMFAKLGCPDHTILSDQTAKETIEDRNTPMGQKPKKIEVEFYVAHYKCAKPDDKKSEEKKSEEDKNKIDDKVEDQKRNLVPDEKNQSSHTNLIDLREEDLPDELDRRQTFNDDDDPIELNRRGIALAREKNYAGAIKLFEKASMIQDFASAKTLNNLGYAEELNGNADKAILYYRHSVLRDANIIPANENLGKLYYQASNYREAVLYGEKTLKLDPNNERVKAWLDDARKKLEQQRSEGEHQHVEEFLLKNRKRESVGIFETKEPFFVQELGIETTQVLHGDKAQAKYFYHTQAGLLSVPAFFYVNFRPARKLSVDVTMGTPYLGVANSGFMAGEQKLEFLYLFKTVSLGTGLLFSQANFAFDDVPNSGEFMRNADFPQNTDVKFGLLFGANTDNGDIKVSVYPRYLFRDYYTASRSVQFDRNYFSFEYAYRFDSVLQLGENSIGWPWRFYVRFKLDEYYITEYKAPTSGKDYSHYFGTYDLTLFGIDFGKLDVEGGKNKFTVGFEYTGRLYFFNKDNKDTTGILNSQGWFGFNTSSALEGNAFPGFRSNSHILQLSSRQSLFGHLIFQESIGYEISGSGEAYHGMFAHIRISYRFEKPREQMAAEADKEGGKQGGKKLINLNTSDRNDKDNKDKSEK